MLRWDILSDMFLFKNIKFVTDKYFEWYVTFKEILFSQDFSFLSLNNYILSIKKIKIMWIRYITNQILISLINTKNVAKGSY